MELRLTLQGHVIFTSELSPKLHDYRSPQFTARIEPAKPMDLGYEVTYRQGINYEQDNVTLKQPG